MKLSSHFVAPLFARWPLLAALLLCLTAIPMTARAAPTQPENVACRPHGGAPDKVRVEWKDTNDGNADYNIYRKAVADNSWGSPVATITDPDGKGRWRWVDENASSTTIYHYRVTADDGNDETTPGADQTCREPLRLESDGPNYRMYYRLVECPDYDGKSSCTENVNVDGQNKHVGEALDTSESYHALLTGYGFNDPAFFDGNKPFPLDFFPCNNGCANSDGIQYRPDWFASGEYDPTTGVGNDYEYFVVGHEIFHKVQGAHGGSKPDPWGKWIIEGQARATEDKLCIFSSNQCAVWDTVAVKYYLGQINAYLGAPEKGLMEASYNAALFWVYIMEQFASTQTEPESGIDVMVQYWQQSEENKSAGSSKDGIGTLNDTLQNKIGTSRRFKDIFQDFAVANYVKDLVSDPPPAGFEQYNYRDEEECVGCGYDPVKRTISQPLGADESVFGTVSVDAWGARYFEIDPNSSLSVISVEVEALPGSPHPMQIDLLAIDNGQVVNQWSGEGTSWEQSVPNINPVYDRLVLIVTAMDHAVNFRYGFNLADGLFILTPDAQFPGLAGETTAPKKFIAKVEVFDTNLDPVAGIDTDDFTITVGNAVINPPANPGDEAIIASTYIGGQYWLVLRAPDNPGCTVCDLTIEYGDYEDAEADAVVYGPQPSVDNIVIIDRSGSMLGDKIEAAKGAANLYVDSYDTGDRLGVISYSDAPSTEFVLTDWTNVTRQQAQTAINGLAVPAGNTATGAALREGMDQLVAQGSPNPAWAMVLLSDGKDTVADTTDHIPEFLKEYKERKDDGDQVPVIHVVAVGDDADGVALEELTAESGGLFQFLPESGLVAAAEGAVANTTLPTDLAEIYRVFAETVRAEQQIYAERYEVGVNKESPAISEILVDGGASQGVFVVKMSPPDGVNVPFMRLQDPDGDQIAPTLTADGHHVWRVSNPEAGTWTMVVRPCGSCPQQYLVEAALISDLTLQVFLGLPPEERLAGKAMPILALLSDIEGITGATVQATVERTGETLTLFDDGLHGDGAANDGFYGGTILNTFEPGGYPVVIDADGVSGLAGPFKRRARVSFYMAGDGDKDEDRLPDWWEGNCTDPAVNDADKDPDNDNLVTAQEFFNHTDPCDPDSDDGGEGDGSEVGRGADPLYAPDDFTDPPRLQAWPGVGQVTLRFSLPNNSPNVQIYRSLGPDGPFILVAEDVRGIEYVDEDAANDQQVCYKIMASGRATSAPSATVCTTPKLDPYAPHGEVVLPPDVIAPVARTTTILLEAYDDPETEEHPIFDGELIGPAVQSGVAEVLLSNRPDFEGAEWEPYTPTRMWTFDPDENGRAAVYVRYRDGAGNESGVAALSVVIDPTLVEDKEVYLPYVAR